MATAAISAEYVEDAADFAAELAENGYECRFGTVGAPANDWEPDGAFVEVGTAYVFPSEWSADFSDDVRNDDLMFFVDASVDVDACSHMVDGDVERELVKVKPFTPDGQTTIYYEVQAR